MNILRSDQMEKIHNLAGKMAGMAIKEAKSYADKNSESILSRQEENNNNTENPLRKEGHILWGYCVVMSHERLKGYKGH